MPTVNSEIDMVMSFSTMRLFYGKIFAVDLFKKHFNNSVEVNSKSNLSGT